MPGGTNHTVLGRVAPRESRALSTSARDNLNHATINIGDVLTERSDPVRDDLTDQSRLVFVEFGRSGIAVPCLFRSFHDPLNSQGAPHDLAR